MSGIVSPMYARYIDLVMPLLFYQTCMSLVIVKIFVKKVLFF